MRLPRLSDYLDYYEIEDLYWYSLAFFVSLTAGRDLLSSVGKHETRLKGEFK